MNEEFSALDRAFAQALELGASPFLCRLMAASRQGHLCLRSSELFANVKWVAEGPCDGSLPTKPIVREQDRYYLQRNWVLETTILQHIKRLLETPPKALFDLKNLVMAPQLTEMQAEAVRKVFSHSLTIITGGPGTGKTFTAIQMMQTLSNALNEQTAFLRVKIAAPTGKAADRLSQGIQMQERLKVETFTLHRLLRLQPGRSRLFEKSNLEADLIVVDEASMMDASLFAHLLVALPEGCRLVLLGDADQLPPVDGASLFPDLAGSLGIRLDLCYRTEKGSLYPLYEAARSGEISSLAKVLEPWPSDLYSWIESEFDLFSEGNFFRKKLICPLRKGPFGVDAMNEELLCRFQKKLTLGQSWAIPIILTRNDPSLELYNGTAGILRGIYQGGKLPYGSEKVELTDGRTFTLLQLPGFEFAFVLSIHKSQGSEFDEVACLLAPGSEEFPREAVYTALTRAKKRARLIGDRETLEKMISSQSKFQNGFRERLRVCR